VATIGAPDSDPPPASSPAPVDTVLADRVAEHTDRASRAGRRAPRAPAVRTGERRAVAVARKQRPRPTIRPAPRRSGAPSRAERRPRIRHRPAVAGRRGAGVVVAFAYAQLGKPYQYGADGPGGFDCSGLTMRAFRKAGVRLPHKAAGQRGRSVSRRAARAGDLVKWGGWHVGVYVGGGWVIHAPKPGDRVKKSRLWGSYRIVRVL